MAHYESLMQKYLFIFFKKKNKKDIIFNSLLIYERGAKKNKFFFGLSSQFDERKQILFAQI